jgi:hypothetical protein
VLDDLRLQGDQPARRRKKTLFLIAQGRYGLGDALGECRSGQSRLVPRLPHKNLLGCGDSTKPCFGLGERLAQTGHSLTRISFDGRTDLLDIDFFDAQVTSAL